MEHQGNLELYLNMTRKELQSLCRKYHLPSNRTHAQLAKSLASYFNKKKRTNSASGLKSIGQNVSCRTSAIPESKLVAGALGKTNSSEDREKSSPRKVLDDGSGHCPPGNQRKCNGRMLDPVAKFASPLPANSKNANSFTSETNNLGKGPGAAAGSQKTNTTQFLGFASDEVRTRSKSRKSLEIKNAQMLLPVAATMSRTCHTVLVPSVHNKVHESSMQSEFVSADEISTRAPSLQFFVMSEKGINLYVDLDSSPLEWVNSLKNEVCIEQKEENNEPITHACCFPHIDNCRQKIPSGMPGVDLQNNKVVGNARSTNSGSCSIVSENCNFNSYPLTVVSGSSALFLGKVPADLPGCLEENQVDSSSHATYSAQGYLAHDTASHPREGITSVQEWVDASCGIIKSNASLRTTKHTVSEDNVNVAPTTADCTKVTYDSSGHDAVINLCDTVKHVSAENNHPSSSEIQVTIEASHFPNVENQNEVCKNSFTGQHVNEMPDTAGICEGSSGSCPPMQMVFEGQMADAQSEVGTTDNKLNKQFNHDFQPLELEDQVLSINDHLESRTPTRGKDTSDCYRYQSLCRNFSKRTSKFDHIEKSHCKRQHVCSENSYRATKKSKGTKAATETKSDDFILPRRSTRLVPK